MLEYEFESNTEELNVIRILPINHTFQSTKFTKHACIFSHCYAVDV